MEPTDLLALNVDEATALAEAGVDLREWSPLADQPYLLLSHAESATAPAVLIDWLRGASCPVICESGLEDDLSRACDLLVADRQAAAVVVNGITANPIAAATLVQLMRITESMPLFDALQVESLAFATLQGGAEYAAWLQANRAEAPFVPTDDGPAVIVSREGGQVSLELNRASNRNAMSVEMRDALNEALAPLLQDASVKQLRITGCGKCFSTGGDLTEFGTVPDPATGHIVRSLTVPGRNLARWSERLGNACVAHVHGSCVGSGIEFPAFAGRVTASHDAWFQLPEVGMGLIPGAGGCISIARRIGRQRTAWLAITGRRIKAERAAEWGLVDELLD